MAPYLWWHGVRRLDALVLTHAHPDHVGGVRGLVRGLRPAEAWEGARPLNGAGYGEWEEALQAARPARSTVLRGYRRTWDGVTVEVLAPRPLRRAPWSVRNDDSVVVQVGYGSVRFLLTGDLEAAGEAALEPRPATVLKVGHHGSRTSTTPGLLAKTGPRVAILSAGHANRFGHPHPDVLARLAAAGVRVLRTDRDGTIEVATDGRRVTACVSRGGCVSW